MSYATNGSNFTDSDADLEQNPGDAPTPAKAVATFDSQVCITFVHSRARLADIDGLSGKAAIDGIVEVGLLADDSAKQVAEVSHYQVKNRVEETLIVIEEL